MVVKASYCAPCSCPNQNFVQNPTIPLGIPITRWGCMEGARLKMDSLQQPAAFNMFLLHFAFCFRAMDNSCRRLDKLRLKFVKQVAIMQFVFGTHLRHCDSLTLGNKAASRKRRGKEESGYVLSHQSPCAFQDLDCPRRTGSTHQCLP